ncbi:hypothetical protein M409DRAFT_22663 [Zasmidium cellare ATCC 36951]|uniref:DUF7071 domain-containing protein n=1 Tax=Zasmidium cellare ATCC 36951 TaxID=1080233 RepID=A0A6A6CJB2_ZASCE|nr:uncharacterized protein M409DRAFT_22663 [Zasmidium cellare ATCC 36951]KAF2167235.1 hypothetical protein M409DRAFT_22663 [Zasmidium cellare ATCC 36951]
MKGTRFERDLVGLERSLGLRSNRGISRQSNKDSPPIQAIVNGMKKIAKEYVDLTTSEIRQSEPLRQEVNDLFEEYAPVIWPDENHQQPEWLEDPDPYKFEGRYPRRLCYSDEEDRETLRALFYNLVVEKCCNYHSNQLQRARTSQRQSLDYLDSAGETPRKAEPGLGAESDSEMVDAESAPPQPISSYHENTYEAREAQFNPGEFSFRVFQDYGMPSTDAGSGPTIKTTEPAPPSSTSAISWTPANMAPKEYTQEPTPSETATSDRPDRSMRPKRKRPQPNEEDLLPKKVSGDRKAKKPRWSQIIPLKVSPHHLARLADGERIAESVPTSPEEETPPPQDDTIMSNAGEEHPASNGGSLSSAPPTPTDEFAADNENIVVKRDPRSNTPPSKPAPERVPESGSQDAREQKSPVDNQPADLPVSNGTSRPESDRPGSESAPPSRPVTGHRENETPKPPPPALTGPARKDLSTMPEVKWRPGFTNTSSQSPLTPANGLHTHHTGPLSTTSPSLSQDGFGSGRPHEREPDAVGGAARPMPQTTAAPNANSPRLDWHHTQHQPGQQRRESQPAPTQDPHAAHRSQISLVEEVLGPLLECPTAREVLRKTPNLSRPQLEDMKRILAHSADAQANFDVFIAHVYGRREDGPNGGSIATALASAIQPPNAPHIAGPPSAAIPKFPPQHVLPSNGPPKSSGPSPRLGAPAPSRRNTRPEDVDRILGDLAACPTVKQVLHKKPDPRRRELKIMRDILRDHPQSRTDLEMLLTRLEARLEAADRESERSPSQDHKERPPTAEPPRGAPLPSPRVTPGHGNPFNAFDSNQFARPQQQQPPPPAHAAEPRYSIVRSPPTSESSRRTETPLHSVDSNSGRQPLPPGTGAFRPAAPQAPADLPKPPLHPPTQPHQQRPPPPHLPSQPLQQPHPHPHQNVHPHPTGNFGPQHAHGPFGRLQNVPGQPPNGPPHHPQHQHPQHGVMSAPAGPGRALIGQQDVFAVRPSPAHNEKEQHQRHNMPIRSSSMQSEPEVQTPQHPAHAMSMSPTPGATATNSLEDVSIEINWARNLDYADYLTGEACLHCKTAGEFFSLIEAQMPDELQGVHGNGNRIKEIRIKALTPLQGEGIMPRIKRDEVSGRPALRKLIKKLRSQPPDADIELEFRVVWE